MFFGLYNYTFPKRLVCFYVLVTRFCIRLFSLFVLLLKELQARQLRPRETDFFNTAS